MQHGPDRAKTALLSHEIKEISAQNSKVIDPQKLYAQICPNSPGKSPNSFSAVATNCRILHSLDSQNSYYQSTVNNFARIEQSVNHILWHRDAVEKALKLYHELNLADFAAELGSYVESLQTNLDILMKQVKSSNIKE